MKLYFSDKWKVLLPIVAISSSTSFAQAVIGTSIRETAVSPHKTNQATNARPTSGGAALSPLGQTPLIQRGPFILRPRIAYNFQYGDGFLRVPGEPENSSIHSVTIGSSLEYRQNVTLDYSVKRNEYSSRLLETTTDQNANLSGRVAFDALTLSASQSYGVNSPTLVETGGQTREETYSTVVGALYELGPRSALDASVTRGVRKASPVLRSAAWTGSDWLQWSGVLQLRYAISKRLDAGAGIETGYDEIAGNPDMSYTQPHLRASWTITDKITLTGKAGREYRIAKTSNAKRDANSIYSTSLQYSLSKSTSLSLVASQNVSASYFSDQTIRSQSWGADLQQRLGGRFLANLGFYKGNSDYLATTRFVSSGRDDSYQAFNFGLSTQWMKRGTLALTYQRSENTSSESLFAFTSDTYGLQLAYSF